MKPSLSLTCAAVLFSACAVQPATPDPARLRPMPSLTPQPAVTAPPATPVIIASPTPAPTPVTYVVQKGDTLVGIAVEYGVSVEALQTANPGLQAQFLSIGTVLTIPVNEADPGAIPVGAPTPVSLEVGPLACYPEVTGLLTCLVEVANTSPQPVTNVALRMVLAGPDGLPLADEAAFAALEVLLPGERAPAAARFALRPADYAAAGATLVSAVGASPQVAARRLTVSVRAGQPTEVGYTVRGQVVNPGSAPASNVWLLLALHGEDGQLLGYHQAPLDGGALGPGESRAFSLSARPLAGNVDHYQIIAEARP